MTFEESIKLRDKALSDLKVVDHIKQIIEQEYGKCKCVTKMSIQDVVYRDIGKRVEEFINGR